MRTITITAHSRPNHLGKVLESLLGQPRDLLRSYELLIGIDPVIDSYGQSLIVSENLDEIDWFRSESGMTVTVIQRGLPLGINWNNHDLIGRAFAIGSSYNVALEDDTVLSPDALRLCDWHQSVVKNLDCRMLNLFSRSLDHEAPADLYYGYDFCPWGWACDADAWITLGWNWISDERGWDWSVNQKMKDRHWPILNPCVSRVRNIGAQGVHHTPETHAKEFPPTLTVQQEPTDGEFRLVSTDELRLRYAGREHLMPRCPTP